MQPSLTAPTAVAVLVGARGGGRKSLLGAPDGGEGGGPLWRCNFHGCHEQFPLFMELVRIKLMSGQVRSLAV
jgi:hypothetical protein